MYAPKTNFYVSVDSCFVGSSGGSSRHRCNEMNTMLVRRNKRFVEYILIDTMTRAADVEKTCVTVLVKTEQIVIRKTMPSS